MTGKTAKGRERSHGLPTLFRLFISLLALPAVLCLFACDKPGHKPAVPAEHVTISYAHPPFTALADIALKKGYFLEEGLEVTPRFYSTGREALDDVLSGRADFATVAETPFMFAVMKEEKISIIATIQTSSRNNVLVARRDRDIHTPGDLKGKKIGVTRGTIGEFFMDTFLTMHGISRDDIEVIELRPEEMSEVLVKGGVDAISAWPPFASQAQKGLWDKGITFCNEDIYSQTFNMVAPQEYILKNPAAVKKLLLALIRAEEFVAQHTAEAPKIVADFRQLDRSMLTEIWGGNKFLITLDQSLLLALEDESRWAIKGGLTEAVKVPNYLEFIYMDGLSSVRPESVRIVR